MDKTKMSVERSKRKTLVSSTFTLRLGKFTSSLRAEVVAEPTRSSAGKERGHPFLPQVELHEDGKRDVIACG
jgi:hypothetical protein